MPAMPKRSITAGPAAATVRVRVTASKLQDNVFFLRPGHCQSAGITAAVSPGGSIRDDEVIAAAEEAGLALVFTGIRHFRH